MIKKARKKPIGIEFCKFERDSIDFLKGWLSHYFYTYSPSDLAADSLIIKTLEGFIEATEGDYIIKGIQGEFYPCKPEIFLASYDIEV